MQMLRLRDTQDFEALLPNKWKIREFLEEGRDVREHGQFRNRQGWRSRPVTDNISMFPGVSTALDEVTEQGLDLILVPGKNRRVLYALLTKKADVAVFSGLAFDKQRDRLGHGRGYYDAYLTRCAEFSAKHGHSAPKTSRFGLRWLALRWTLLLTVIARAVALALDEQILDGEERIPTISTALDAASGRAHKDLKPDAILFPKAELQA